MRVTKTINPLPFQDLEPKRFEDLIRQLIYDFRVWGRLEATGRSGADEGFDARGIESVNPPNDIDSDNSVSDNDNERVWLIQCKREKSITPQKLISHLKEIKLIDNPQLHGVIFAASCDFSKKTRDVFHTWAKENGISESIIWGKAELEDALFQSKNDNLLFAYFGISLSIRRKNLASQVKYDISVKKKLKSCLSIGRDLIIRDPSLDDYPFSNNKLITPSWLHCEYMLLGVKSLIVELKSCPAYVNDETLEWDAADNACTHKYHSAVEHVFGKDNMDLISVARKESNQLSDFRSTELLFLYRVPYSNILAIDDTCEDSFFDGVQVFITASKIKKHNFNESQLLLATRSINGDFITLEPENRVKKFSETLRRDINSHIPTLG
ncbi:Uncharacterised protein [Serratia proteamaculans]|uniref:restriction endonuclease n=1 Tax=Serratia proteamaculans TaxID=28151 RepID=UPI0021832DBC|nr:restriction endonuclease [Serratia proteamaculans]CAI2505372.1 Uncharacterised protein [Serratia proteamaculans]